ncbi:DEAD/DEAH box helicase [Citricoccus sp. GCM10030269]|uniref:DEAD/DEAH box helicase n=1 Tax=Citricoccus sp. GCM10030269 TaxID=3273388 RepID=UPI00360C8A42
MSVDITYDAALIEEIAARFDLRDPNKRALSALVERISKGTDFQELVADLATGVGKTYLMSSLIDYLAAQGVRHVLVVTPGSTIQRKTLANFDAASAKYVAGAEYVPFLVTPENFQAANVGAVLRDPRRLKVFVFNVQQLIRPSDKVSRKVRSEDENLGDALYSHLEAAGDLFVIADEHHVYHEKAKAFSAGIRDLNPVAMVGLTATPAKADLPKVAFEYTLGEAIADGHVKVPVIVYRKDGTKDERTQLADACRLLANKEESYRIFREVNPDAPAVKPCLFVVCQTIDHAAEVAQMLAGSGFIGDGSQVLQITSQSSDEALEALASVENPDSPIRAIVSVNMLREGWDVKNIAVIVALRKLASQTLTEQILGRGLRLPFAQRTGVPDVDQVDLVAHDSYAQLLAQKDVLRQRIQLPSSKVEVDENGAAMTATVDPAQPLDPTRATIGPGGQQSILPVDSPVPGQWSLFDTDPSRGQPGLSDDETQAAGGGSAAADPAAALAFQETGSRLQAKAPAPVNRTQGAPKIIFPRLESRLSYAPFSLSDISNADAERAGAAFAEEVPTFMFRDALEATRQGDDVTIKVTPQGRTEAGQRFEGLDIVYDSLVKLIMHQPEVPSELGSKNAARRLVQAFLRGAGAVENGDHVESWGQKRREQAVDGMRRMIREKIASRAPQTEYEIVPVELPDEPVLVSTAAVDAYDGQRFAKGMQYTGWQKNIMPVASFDAGTTEWELAMLMDRDPDIEWWIRVYVHREAFIPTGNGKYYPDFIALDKAGEYWLLEGKADSEALDECVLVKKKAAESWARRVSDDGRFGRWHYLFATESDIAKAGASWKVLVNITKPE